MMRTKNDDHDMTVMYKTFVNSKRLLCRLPQSQSQSQSQSNMIFSPFPFI